MRVLIQRVREASVTVEGETIGAIGQGLLCFICGMPDDTSETVSYMAGKVAKMRVFSDPDGKMNMAIGDVGGAVLAVSQFTLSARWRKGNRPGFSDAAAPELGEKLYQEFCEALRGHGLTVETGQFAADMKVALVNDGPVTIWMDSEDPR